MHQYSEEVQKHIKNNVLTCHSKELAGFAISCGMTYGKFMSALYLDAIEVKLTNKEKVSRRPIHISAATFSPVKHRGKTITAYDLETGEKVMEFESVGAAARFFNVSRKMISYYISDKHKHFRQNGKIDYRLEYKE